MDFLQDIKGFGEYLKKYTKLIAAIYIVLEILIFSQIGTKYMFMGVANLFIVLYIIVSIFLMLKDFDTFLKIFFVTVPLLPIALYLFTRLNMNWLTDVLYITYFAIVLINIYKEARNKNVDFKSLFNGKKYLLLSIVILMLTTLGIISALNSTHVMESLNTFFLGFIFTLVSSIVILCHENNKVNTFKDIFLYLSIGVVVSGIPDIIITAYFLLAKNTVQHLYGPLGSNFMLGYSIIILPILLFNSVNNKISGNNLKIYRMLMMVETIVLSFQMSRGVLVVIVAIFLFVIIYDRKRWLKYGIFGLIIISCVTYNVSNRWEFNYIKEDIKQEGMSKVLKTKFDTKSEFLNRILEQARNRTPIWGLTIDMIADHSYLGVGPGNYKYYYLPYGGEIERSYKDAHNIILTTTAEFGLPFSILFFLTYFVILMKALIGAIKRRGQKLSSILYLGFVGLICFLIYGNITGQAFMTYVYPISIVPAFVFGTLILSMVAMYKDSQEGEI